MKKEEKNSVYIMCPRCELNYITKKDKYCNVCKAELGLLDPNILIPDEEEVGVEKLCPVCRVNYIGEDEEICFICQKEKDEKEIPVLEEADDSWREFVDDAEDIVPADDMEIPLSELEEEEEAEEEDEFADKYKEPDDFDFDVDPDDYVDEDELDEDADWEDDVTEGK